MRFCDSQKRDIYYFATQRQYVNLHNWDTVFSGVKLNLHIYDFQQIMLRWANGFHTKIFFRMKLYWNKINYLTVMDLAIQLFYMLHSCIFTAHSVINIYIKIQIYSPVKPLYITKDKIIQL